MSSSNAGPQKIAFIRKKKTNDGSGEGASKSGGGSEVPKMSSSNNSNSGSSRGNFWGNRKNSETSRDSNSAQPEPAVKSSEASAGKIVIRKRDKVSNPIAPKQTSSAPPSSFLDDPAIQCVKIAGTEVKPKEPTPSSNSAPSNSAPSTPTPAETPSPTTPTPASWPAKEERTFEQCDLCGCDCPAELVEEHVIKSHKDLISRIKVLTEGIHRLKLNPVDLDDDVLTGFGRFIEADVAPSDQGEAVFKRALSAHDQVSRLVLRRFPHCKVFMFGSTVSMGSWDGAGDVDLTLVDPKGWDDGSWPGNAETEGQRIMRLAGICREAGFEHDDLEPLRRVRVPVLKHKRPFKLDLSEHTGTYVVKFKFDRPPKPDEVKVIEAYFKNAATTRWQDNIRFLVGYKTGVEAFDTYMGQHRQLPNHEMFWESFASAPEMFGIDFDLSTRAHGIRNSWLLRKYMEQSSLARAGSVFLKHWSKASGVNYSMKGYFTSYAINILWVNYLLTRGLVKFIDPFVDVEGSADKSTVAATYLPLLDPSVKDSPQFIKDVAHAVYDFFCFYAYEFDWENNVVSIRRSTPTTKASLGWTTDKEQRFGNFRDRVWYRVCIEDPFEANLNLGRHASMPKAFKIRSQFSRAALTIVSGSYEKVLQDNSTSAGLERVQRLLPRVMLGFANDATIEQVLAGIEEVDPDVLAAVETEYSFNKIAECCDCVVEEDDGKVTPKTATALVDSNAAGLVAVVDAEVAAAGKVGVPFTKEHDLYNVHPLYYSSKNSKRLFGSGKHMRRFDEHLAEVRKALPNDHVTLLERLKETVPNVDVAIVEAILKDTRLIEFIVSKNVFSVSRKAVEELKNQVETMDVASRQMGNCDDCGKRSQVYSSSKGGRTKYCEPCWEYFLSQNKK